MHRVLTDCDGVLLDWASGFERYLRETCGRPQIWPAARITANTPVEWAMEAYEVSFDEALERLTAFQTHPFFGRLRAYPDAQEWVPRIAFDFDIRFHVISSPGLHATTAQLRAENLRCFGDVFCGVTLLAGTACKRETLAGHPPSLWFDDHAPHVISGHELGHHAFHFDREGRLDPRVPNRVCDWQAVHAWMRAHPPSRWQAADVEAVA